MHWILICLSSDSNLLWCFRMAWSLPFTGRRSIVRDSYQRLALEVSVDRIGDSALHNSIQSLSKANMLHLSVYTTREHVRGNKASFVLSNIQALCPLIAQIEKLWEPSVIVDDTDKISVALEHQPKRMFTTIHIPHDAVDFVKAMSTLPFCFDLVVVHVQGDKPSARQNLINTFEIFDAMKCVTSLGLGGCIDNNELDWYLSKIPPHMLKLVHIGEVHLPNLKLHSIELAHTLGYNTMVSVTQQALLSDFVNESVLVQLSEKYSVPPNTVLLKAILQLGCIACIPFDNQAVNCAFIQNHLSRLCHPFVHRKSFVSSNKIITFQISSEDMAILTEMSEEYEAGETDVHWQQHSRGRAPDRELTYHK